MSQETLNKIFDGLSKTRREAEELKVIANALHITGNSTLAENLFEIAEEILAQQEIIQKNYAKEGSEALNEAQEFNGKMLSLLLNKDDQVKL